MKDWPDRLGRYRVLRPLARGGMAELFLTRATGIQGFEKLVVVKRVLPELARDSEYVDMFLDEARLAARLHHSNLVQVYDIGEADGLPFYAMEYLDGHDVRAMVRVAAARKERIPLEHALSIVIGAAAGLHYAHELRDEEGRPLGIVHRDVSPQNVAVTFDGGVKLFDFGVAKAKRRATETRHGTLKGKIQYMSPEQCRGEEVDRRSDVFSVGILLWELTTGRRLYGGRSDFGVMKSIAEADAPKPSLVWQDYPPELEAILMRALRRERQARFATMEELQLALEAFARERRLAVSGVGLGKHLRHMFTGLPTGEGDLDVSSLYEVEIVDDDAGPATVVDGVFSISIPLVTPDEVGMVMASEGPGERERQTRAVGRALKRRRQRRLPPLAAALLLTMLAATGIGGAVAWRLRANARRQARPQAAATAATPLPDATTPATAPAAEDATAAQATVKVVPSRPDEAATTSGGTVGSTTAAPAPTGRASPEADSVSLADDKRGADELRERSLHPNKRGHASRGHAHPSAKIPARSSAPATTAPAAAPAPPSKVDLDDPLPPR